MASIWAEPSGNFLFWKTKVQKKTLVRKEIWPRSNKILIQKCIFVSVATMNYKIFFKIFSPKSTNFRNPRILYIFSSLKFFLSWEHWVWSKLRRMNKYLNSKNSKGNSGQRESLNNFEIKVNFNEWNIFDDVVTL